MQTGKWMLMQVKVTEQKMTKLGTRGSPKLLTKIKW